MAYIEPVNQTGLTSIMQYANSVTGGWYGIGIIITLYFIIFIYLKLSGEETPNCFVVASYISGIASVFMFFMDIGFTGTHLFIFILLTALSTVWAFWNK